jgi:hypothetical protein
MNISLSDIRMMILCEFHLSTEEIGHQYYDGEGVKKASKKLTFGIALPSVRVITVWTHLLTTLTPR